MNHARKNTVLVLASLALFGMAVPVAPAAAEAVTQTIATVNIDVQKLSTGYRASKLIGSTVINDAHETVGKIDDLIVNPDDNRSAYVILSVGGWLGLGTHLVAIPYEDFQITGTKIALPKATKELFKHMPEFKYSAQ